MIFLKVIELHSQIQETESRLVFETERDSIQELDVYQITGMSVGAARHGLPLDWQIKLNTIVMTQRQEAATAGLPLLSASSWASITKRFHAIASRHLWSQCLVQKWESSQYRCPTALFVSQKQ